MRPRHVQNSVTSNGAPRSRTVSARPSSRSARIAFGQRWNPPPTSVAPTWSSCSNTFASMPAERSPAAAARPPIPPPTTITRIATPPSRCRRHHVLDLHAPGDRRRQLKEGVADLRPRRIGQRARARELPRHRLELRRARNATPLVLPQRRVQIARGSDRVRDRERVLQRLRGALPDRERHRVGRVAEQGHAARAPLLVRRPVEDVGPEDRAVVGSVDDRVDGIGEAGEPLVDELLALTGRILLARRSGDDPLPAPALWARAEDDELGPRTPPGREVDTRCDLGLEPLDVRPPHRQAGVAEGLVAEELLADHRLQ